MLTTKTPTLLARLSAGLLLVALGACQNAPVASPQAALLVAPSDASKAQLQQLVSQALNANVTLSTTALTEQPTLIIDAPSRPHSIENTGPQSTWLDRPDHFSLWLIEGQCRLKHQESEQEWPIDGATCVAVDNGH
jgi:hypothetical protein